MYRELAAERKAILSNTASLHADSLSTDALLQKNQVFRGTGGVSEGNTGKGFRPAFLDQSTGSVYLSRFANGRVAPLHVLDGLSAELVADRKPNGRFKSVRGCVIAGFLRAGLLYTREQAARAVSYY